MAFNNDEGGQGSGFQKPTFKGNWTCGTCGAKITELRFQPSPDPERLKTLKCLDCWKKNRPQRDRF